MRINKVVWVTLFEITPKYNLDAFSSSLPSLAKNEFFISLICVGKIQLFLLYNALICESEFLIVAVEAIILGLILFFLKNSSNIISYNPSIVPRGPAIKWSSSWIIKSGGKMLSSSNPNNFLIIFLC